MLQTIARPRIESTEAAMSRQDITDLIVKLRWMGMDQDADKLCRLLGDMVPEGCAPICVCETD